MSFLAELRRRNVFRVAATYAIVMWLIIQVVSAVSAPLNLPNWFETVVIVLLAIGFPVALVLAWAFEMTPDGLRYTQPHSGEVSSGGHRLDYVLIGALVLLAVITGWDHLPTRSIGTADEAPPMMDNPSIAVLPFVDMSPDGDQAYFGDGIAEELLNVLTRLDGLRVAGRTSSFAYRGRDEDLRSIGFDYFIVSNATAGVPREARHRMMRRFTEEVVPIVTRTPVPEEPAIPARAAE